MSHVLRAHRFVREEPVPIEVDVLVTTSVYRVCLRQSLIDQLKLTQTDLIQVRTSNGIEARNLYDPVRIEVGGRRGTFEVVGVEDTMPNILGELALITLDLQIDATTKRLIEHPSGGVLAMTEEF